MDRRNARCHAVDLRCNSGARGIQHRFNLGAFPRSRRFEIAQRGVNEPRNFVRECGRWDRGIGQHARPTQNFVDSQWRRSWGVTDHVGRRRSQLADATGVDGQRCVANACTVQRHAALDFAAFHRGRQLFAQDRLNGAQFVRQLDGQVEITVVDRAQIDGQGHSG